MICTAPAGNVRAVERRSARADRRSPNGDATRWHYALDVPPAGLPRHPGGGPFVELARPRRSDRRRRLLLRGAGPGGRRAPQLRPHRRDDRLLLGAIGVPYPHAALQPDHRRRVHLRRHGEHHRHHADRSGAARRAGRAGSRRRRAGLARAGAPVVGRSAHLPRVVRGLAERRVRHLLRVRLARARQGARRGRPSSCSSTPTATWPRPGATSGRSSAGSTTSRSTCSTRTSTRRAAACCTCCGTSWATGRSGAPSATTRASTRAGRSRRAIWRAPSRRSPGATSSELLDRWIARPGHPELEGRWEWDEERKVGTLRARPEAGGHARGAAVRVLDDASASRSTARARRAREPSARRRTASSSSCRPRPTQVIFDPGDVVLKIDQAREERGRSGGGSWRRRELGIDRVAGGARAGRAARSGRRRGARRRRCGDDPFWGVRAAAARALGQHPARRRARRADGRARRRPPARAARGRRRRWATDRATRRRARALAAELLRAATQLLRRGRGGAGARTHALAAGASSCCRRWSIGRRSRTCIAQPRHRGARPTGDERAFPLIRDAWRAGAPLVRPARGRRGAGRAGPRHRPAPARRASRSRRGCAIGDFRVRGEAAMALARLGLVEAIPAIRSALAGELDGRARRRMSDAIRDLRRRHPPRRGGPPAARRGRAPARRDRQAARAPGPRRRAPGPPPAARRAARPRPAPRPVTRRGPRPRPVGASRSRRAARDLRSRLTASRTGAARLAVGRATRLTRLRQSVLQLGDDRRGRSGGRAAARRAGSRWRRRPGGRRRRSARRSC